MTQAALPGPSGQSNTSHCGAHPSDVPCRPRRKEELAHMLQLNRSGFGAALLGTFDGGRFEQFLPCVTMDADMTT